MTKPVYRVRLAPPPPQADAEIDVEVKASNRREAEVLARARYPGYRRVSRVVRIARPAAGSPRGGCAD